MTTRHRRAAIEAAARATEAAYKGSRQEVIDRLWPVAILQDRYHGCYSKGAWIAIGDFEREAAPGKDRLAWASDGIYESDGECDDFWHQVRADKIIWLAVGDTPDAALTKLIEQNQENPDDGKRHR